MYVLPDFPVTSVKFAFQPREVCNVKRTTKTVFRINGK